MAADARYQEAVVEAVLFTMGKSVETAELAAALGCTREEAAAAAGRLAKRCDEEGRGLQLLRLEDSWQLATRQEHYEALSRVAKTPKKQSLSQAVLETLSIIAYRQPVTKAEIAKIRGVSSDHAVNKLIEYGLVCEVGRLDAPGRPVLFATTEEFLRRFGVDSREDLPEATPDQEAELRDEVSREINYRFGTEPGVPEEGAAAEEKEEDAREAMADRGKAAAAEAEEVKDAAAVIAAEAAAAKEDAEGATAADREQGDAAAEKQEASGEDRGGEEPGERGDGEERTGGNQGEVFYGQN